MQWLTLRRVTNYAEKHRLLSTDYKSPSNGQPGEKKGRSEARHQARPGILSLKTEVLRVNYWFRVSSITATNNRAIAQVHCESVYNHCCEDITR